MQNWKADKDQNEDDKHDKSGRANPDESQKRPAAATDSDESSADRHKPQKDASQQGSVQQSAVVPPKSRIAKQPISYQSPSKSPRHQRAGTKSVPLKGSRGQYHHSKQPRTVQDDDSARNSTSASTKVQHIMINALSVPIHKDDAPQEVNVEAVQRLEEFALSTLARPFDAIVKEYTKKISTIAAYEWMCEASKQNAAKNRYKDIACLDSTRVILRDLDGETRRDGNYIHANYVSSDELRNTYILTQGPKKETVIEFWHMVWQVQCPIIIMLCDNIENGKKKCLQYLPPNNSTVQVASSTGKMTIQTSGGKKHSGGSLIETHLILKENGKELNVKHWKWTGWGDFKVPSEFQTVFRLLREIRHSERGFPIVHCSAGVGRSGTLIALEVCLAVLRNGKALNVKNCVETVRRQRAHSVQTVVQYLFVYRALLEMAAVNDVITQAQMKEFRLAYDKAVKKDR